LDVAAAPCYTEGVSQNASALDYSAADYNASSTCTTYINSIILGLPDPIFNTRMIFLCFRVWIAFRVGITHEQLCAA
jgi:hypothetical protein